MHQAQTPGPTLHGACNCTPWHLSCIDRAVVQVCIAEGTCRSATYTDTDELLFKTSAITKASICCQASKQQILQCNIVMRCQTLVQPYAKHHAQCFATISRPTWPTTTALTATWALAACTRSRLRQLGERATTTIRTTRCAQRPDTSITGVLVQKVSVWRCRFALTCRAMHRVRRCCSAEQVLCERSRHVASARCRISPRTYTDHATG